jgi:hypothetical protein
LLLSVDACRCLLRLLLLSAVCCLLQQISQAAMSPASSFIATPAASWIDDFLSWTNPSLPKCCR